jgi:tyrosine-protein kinase Etk/Wzc
LEKDKSYLGERKTVKSSLEEFNPGIFLHIVRKSVIWVILLVSLFYVGARLYLRFATEIYQSQATIMLKSQKETQVLGVGDIISDHRNSIDLEIQLLKSKFLISKALENLDLELEFYAKGKIKNTPLYRSIPFDVDFELLDEQLFNNELTIKILSDGKIRLSYNTDDGKKDFLLKPGKEESNQVFKSTFSKKEHIDINSLIGNEYILIPKKFSTVVDEVASTIQIVPVNINTRTIRIIYKSDHPTKARDIVNAVASTFIDYDKEKKTESINSIIAFLDVQIENFSSDYFDFQDTLKNFRIDMGFVDPTNQISMILSKLQEAERERANLGLNDNILKWFKNYLDSDKNLGLISSILLEGKTISFEREVNAITDLEAERNQLLLSVTPEHPRIGIINTEIAKQKQRLVEIVNMAIENNNQKKALLERETMQQFGRLYELPDKETAFSRLKRENSIRESFYNNLLDNRNRYLISKAGILTDYFFLQTPTTPKEPISPQPLFIQGVALVLGFLVGLLLIVARYLMHQKVVSSREIESSCNANLLGVIPKYKDDLVRSQVVVTESPKSSIAEAFRAVRSNLEFIDSSDKSKLVVTTSTIPGEGKTFVGINLAAIFSLLDKKVIIVDYDLRKPRLGKIFGNSEKKGVSTVLIGKTSLEESIFSTGIKNLDYMPSGPVPPNPAELISKKETRDLIEKLQSMYDYVLIDTPPIGLVTDAIDLLKIADYPIYVVRADYSEKSFLENINRIIFDNEILRLSVVLNDMGRGASSFASGQYGSYGYSYGYGYGNKYGYGYYSDDVQEEKTLRGKIWKLINKISGKG